MEALKKVDEEHQREFREQTIEQCLKSLKAKNESETLATGLEILSKLCGNILKSPTEQKFRVMNLTNQKIQERLLRLEPQEELFLLLEMLGYIKEKDGNLRFLGDYFTVLKRGTVLIQ